MTKSDRDLLLPLSHSELNGLVSKFLSSIPHEG